MCWSKIFWLFLLADSHTCSVARRKMQMLTSFFLNLMFLYKWISVGSDLKFDARRDLDDVGASCIQGNLGIYKDRITSACMLSIVMHAY